MTTFDSTGASIDSYAQVRAKISAAVKGALGSDMLTDDEDSVVGKIVTIAADVANTANEGLQYAVAVRDPDAASGVPLKKLVKLNGITANEGLYSTVAITVLANAGGTKILAGDMVADPSYPDTLWAIDSQVILAPLASAIASATCKTLGAIPAAPETLTLIKTPRQGWQSCTNESAASIGQNPDSEAGLRRRRERAARSFGKTTISGVWSALEDIDDVSEVFVHQNLLLVADGFGVPGRAMQAFIRGGNDATIAELLFKTAPLATYGAVTTNYSYRGHVYPINYSRPTDTGITVEVALSPISSTSPADFPDNGEAAVKAAIMAFSASNQLMGIDAIPQQFAAVANVVPGYYVASSTVNGAGTIVSADMGEALIVADADDITVTVVP